MEQIKNVSPKAATDEPASPSTRRKPARSLGRVSDQLTESLIEEARDAGCAGEPGRAQREDGWTPERIGTFLHALAQCGVVADAARAAGMSKRGAYALRSRAKGRAFSLAWRAARMLARQRIADHLVSRAIHGCVEVIVRDGKVWGERHHFDNRLTMAVLSRLDEEATAMNFDPETRAARHVAGEFEQFVDIVASGDSDAAASFIEHRERSLRAVFGPVDEAEMFRRVGNFERYGVGHPREIKTSDLDPNKIDRWTPEQQERADRSDLIDNLIEAELRKEDRSRRTRSR